MRGHLHLSTRTSRVRRLLAGALIAAAVIATATPAGASATGLSFFAVRGTTGTYTVNINGSGTWVNYVTGTWRTDGGMLCNQEVTAEFFDSAGRWYETRSRSAGVGCSTGGSLRVDISGNRRSGTMCSTLYAEVPLPPYNRQRVTSVCHGIR